MTYKETENREPLGNGHAAEFFPGQMPTVDLEVTHSSFCGSVRKFSSWLAGSSCKMWLKPQATRVARNLTFSNTAGAEFG